MSVGILGFLFQGITVYSYVGTEIKAKQITSHLISMIGSLIFCISGFIVIVKAKDMEHMEHFETDHSRAGLLIIVFLILQFLVGSRKGYLKITRAQSVLLWHSRLGLVIPILATLNVASGVRQLFPFNYSLVAWGLLGTLAIVVIFFEFLVSFHSTRSPTFYGKNVYFDEKEALIH